MIVEEAFENVIYPGLKSYVETNSIYNPKVTKAMPFESKVFPIVPVKLLQVQNTYNNLNYGEETYSFGIEVQIFAQDVSIQGTEANTKVSKRTVCNEVTEKVVEYFKDNYHVTVNTELDVANVDTNVHRNLVRIQGTLDTKYGENNLVIYPR